jgi:hypothetical protein
MSQSLRARDTSEHRRQREHSQRGCTVADQEPFVQNVSEEELDTPSTAIFATTAPVPAGKRFVVEHISGTVAISDGFPLDEISATTQTGQQVHLPEHLESRPLNFGGNFGVARVHQFGSPVRMYVEAGDTITVRGDGQFAGRLDACLIGYLVTV